MPSFKTPSDAHLYAAEYGGQLSRRGLEIVNIYADSVDRSVLNHAPDKPVPDGVIGGGAPAMGGGGGWIELSGADYMLQFATDSANATFYSVVSSLDTMADDAHRPTYWSNGLNFPQSGESGNSFGNRLCNTVTGNIRFGAGFGNSLSDDETVTGAVAAANGAWHLLVTKIFASGASQGITMFNATTGASMAPVTTALPRYPVIGPYRIGSVRSQAQLGTNRQKWWQKHSAINTDIEDARNIAQIVKYQRQRFGLDLVPGLVTG